VRCELDEQETSDWLAAAEARLAALHQAIEQGNYELLGQVPDRAHVVARLQHWLASRGPLRIAARPHAT
jgi:hypothetical protein